LVEGSLEGFIKGFIEGFIEGFIKGFGVGGGIILRDPRQALRDITTGLSDRLKTLTLKKPLTLMLVPKSIYRD
jgi:hypothetical protein